MMLPDFPKTKSKIRKIFNQYLFVRHQFYLGFWSNVPSRSQHEGNSWQINRADGSVEKSSYDELSGSFSIDLDEVPLLTFDKVLEKLDGVAREMASKMEKSFFEKLNETINSIDGKGKPFNKDMYLEMLDTIDMSFDKEGKPNQLSLIMHPKMAERVNEEMPEWEDDEEFKRKYEKIIRKKREEWRDRESNRKLVD